MLVMVASAFLDGLSQDNDAWLEQLVPHAPPTALTAGSHNRLVALSITMIEYRFDLPP